MFKVLITTALFLTLSGFAQNTGELSLKKLTTNKQVTPQVTKVTPTLPIEESVKTSLLDSILISPPTILVGKDTEDGVINPSLFFPSRQQTPIALEDAEATPHVHQLRGKQVLLINSKGAGIWNEEGKRTNWWPGEYAMGTLVNEKQVILLDSKDNFLAYDLKQRASYQLEVFPASENTLRIVASPNGRIAAIISDRQIAFVDMETFKTFRTVNVAQWIDDKYRKTYPGPHVLDSKEIHFSTDSNYLVTLAVRDRQGPIAAGRVQPQLIVRTPVFTEEAPALVGESVVKASFSQFAGLRPHDAGKDDLLVFTGANVARQFALFVVNLTTGNVENAYSLKRRFESNEAIGVHRHGNQIAIPYSSGVALIDRKGNTLTPLKVAEEPLSISNANFYTDRTGKYLQLATDVGVYYQIAIGD